MIAASAIRVEVVTRERSRRVQGVPRLGHLVTQSGPVGVMQNVLHDPQLSRSAPAGCGEPFMRPTLAGLPCCFIAGMEV